ncbi:MAG TPA: FKBP-type peptidyl-prolyl cis-trans isomerase [Novosphingobium sp.]|nr:FKBP-type peptidyl-prolyl cis-trans isomerase [Novosphingobium sp.]HZV10189.1 FKBP-type peptidyl-prolyl cis-trans isomerase [Novosphingobium sp.]
MTEITRVPLQPLTKGSIKKLWLGVVAASLAGAAIAGAGMPPLVSVKTLTPGFGPSPSGDALVQINYVGKLANGTVFDQGKGAVLPLQGTIPGFAKALAQTQKGGKYVFRIPARLAYGPIAQGPIPANSDLTFEVEVLDFRSRAELEAQQRMMEQMMRAQGAHQQAPQAGDAAPAPQAAPAQ